MLKSSAKLAFVISSFCRKLLMLTSASGLDQDVFSFEKSRVLKSKVCGTINASDGFDQVVSSSMSELSLSGDVLLPLESCGVVSSLTRCELGWVVVVGFSIDAETKFSRATCFSLRRRPTCVNVCG